MADTFLSFIQENYWIIIIFIIVILLLVASVVYAVCKCSCRFQNYRRYDYTALEEDLALPEKMEMEKRMKREAIRETALITCQFYLRSSGIYTMMDHLNEMGSRVNKTWFLVKHIKTKRDYLLTLVPRSPQMVVPFTKLTLETINGIFSSIQHPYIYPIHQVDFVEEQDLIGVVQPLNAKGSLKDLIYQARCMDCWGEKYNCRSKCLPIEQVRLFGRQILEALMYLEDKGLRPFCHLHSGNVMVVNNICKLTGFENNFFGFTSRASTLIRRRIKDNKNSIDTMCFGHLLFEMCSGYELDTAEPDTKHLISLGNSPALEVLDYIFARENDGYPSIKDISKHSFFKDVRCKELQSFYPPVVKLNSNMKNLLKAVRKGKKDRKLSRSKSHIEREQGNRRRSRTKESITPPPPTASTSKKSPLPPAPPMPPAAPSLPPPTMPLKSENKNYAPNKALVSSGNGSSRSALLGDIRMGRQLKSVTTNDRSNPRV
ncbi:unnamed protein product [Owenia fusiformis]|uniref:Uncharacterized protein n=1 Tax=Owenia fusiformis TaxID=6347 RepID=A0A8J1XF70_OWEFU|nr:unnamed protein product [Owenia fusiformis]